MTNNLSTGWAETGYAKGGLDQDKMLPRLGSLGFTLIELLVVISIIALLAALLLPVFSRAKTEAQRIQCVNNLHEIGIALRAYVDDNHAYPVAFDLWYNSLVPYNRLQWTNAGLHCPTYRGVIRAPNSSVVEPNSWLAAGSYSYSIAGTGGCTPLGLGGWNPGWDRIPIGTNWLAISESWVKVPSEMFAIADARVVTFGVASFVGGTITVSSETIGDPFMPWPGGIASELQPLRHGKGFNFLFCDGHVSLVKRSSFLNPTNSWQNWNNDHEPHEETWN